MTRGYILHEQFARANPEVVLSERAVHPSGLWFEERKVYPAIDKLVNMQDLDDQLVAFIHIPTLVTMTAALDDEEYAVFVKTVGHIVDIVWTITSGWPDFWPDWEQARRMMVEENIEHAKLLVQYPFSE